MIAQATSWNVLNGRRFSAAEIVNAAADSAHMTQHTLTNLLTKSDLLLCSDSEGKGKARQFCLVDVYQLVVTAKLAELTGNVRRAAEAANFMLLPRLGPQAQSVAALRRLHESGCEGNGWLSEEDRNAIEEARQLYRTSTTHLPECYTHRDLDNPLYLLQFWSKGRGLSYPKVVTQGSNDFAWFSTVGGILVNITQEFARIDTNLLRPSETKRPSSNSAAAL